MKLYIITGLSGSGKSVALKALEDFNFYCVDNLPAMLLRSCINTLKQQGYTNVAISLDMRNPVSITSLPQEILAIRDNKIDLEVIFLDATNESLIKRFSETRRPHPLSVGDMTITECIKLERELLEPLNDIARKLDTSNMKPNQLRDWVRVFLKNEPDQFKMVLQSFGFKRGVPLDTDFTFDVRCLPNPFYIEDLKDLPGTDDKISLFFSERSDVADLTKDMENFLKKWIPQFMKSGRKTVAISVGCTGGKHRSVHVVEKLATNLEKDYHLIIRHRDLA